MSVPLQRLKLIRATAAILVLAGGSYYAWASANSQADRIFHGSIEVRDVQLGFRTAGRVSEVLVEEGAGVRAGQLLARLDAEPYQRARDESAAARDEARARYELVRRGHDRFDIAEAEARVLELRATVANAERNATRMAGLAASGAQSQRALDDALAHRDESAARLRAAGQTLAGLRRGYRREEIDAARASAARAEAAFARAELQLTDTQLRAPETGVVQARAVDPGSMIAVGATALVLARTSETWVRAYVPEPMLGRAVPGATVELLTDVREAPYQARVGSVATQAEFTPKSVETSDLRTSLMYRVRLRVLDPDAALRQGMPVTLRFATDSER